MFKTYEGMYSGIEKSYFKGTLQGLKDRIEHSMGEDFKDYTTAWIYEYNLFTFPFSVSIILIFVSNIIFTN